MRNGTSETGKRIYIVHRSFLRGFAYTVRELMFRLGSKSYLLKHWLVQYYGNEHVNVYRTLPAVTVYAWHVNYCVCGQPFELSVICPGYGDCCMSGIWKVF
jgi:hypothetical protein